MARQAKGITLPIVYKSNPKGLQDAAKGLNSFRSTVVKVGAALAGAFSVRSLVDFAKTSVTAASDLSESMNAISVAYGKASGDIAKLGEDAASRLGVTQTAFNEAAVRFSAFADRVVGSGGDVAGFVDDITTRAADFASVYNIDVAEALQVFQSGLAGEAEPLKRFGVNLLQSEVQAYALREGIIGVGETMTETQKVQARYGLLLESTAKTAGDFANTSDGLANSQRILSANFSQMQALIGTELLPVFAALTGSLIPIVEEITPMLAEAFRQVAPAITNIATQIPGLLKQLTPLIPLIADIVTLFLELAVAALPFVVEFISALIPVIQGLMPVIMNLVDSALEPVMSVFYLLLEALTPIISSLLPVLTQLFLALTPIILELFYAFEPLIMALLPLLIELIEFLIPILEVTAGIIGELLVTAIDFFVDAIDGVTGTIDVFAGFFEESFGGLGDFFYTLINGWIGLFEGFVNSIIRGLNWMIGEINKFKVKVPNYKIFGELAGKSFGFNFSKIAEVSLPRIALAQGGIVTQPTQALIGEAGPEAVIPLDRMNRMAPTYNITVNAGVGDPVRIGEEVVNAIKRYERVSGPVFASA